MSTAIDGVTAFPMYAEAVTPSDATVFATPSTVFAGAAGNVAVTPWAGSGPVTFTMPAGGYVPVLVRQVLATGTTATGLVRVY